MLEGFLAIARREPERVTQIDARDAMAQVQREILKLMQERFFAPAKAKN